jgi:Cytochrome P460
MNKRGRMNRCLTLFEHTMGHGSRLSAFVVGSRVNMQIMVKDSKKYAATGGWGFGDFKDGKPGDEALHKTCFACHEPARDRDFVFTHYAP